MFPDELKRRKFCESSIFEFGKFMQIQWIWCVMEHVGGYCRVYNLQYKLVCKAFAEFKEVELAHYIQAEVKPKVLKTKQ